MAVSTQPDNEILVTEKSYEPLMRIGGFDPFVLHRGPLFDIRRMVGGLEEGDVTYADVYTMLSPYSGEIPVDENRDPMMFIHTEKGIGHLLRMQYESLGKFVDDQNFGELWKGVEDQYEVIVRLMRDAGLNSRAQHSRAQEVRDWFLSLREEGYDPFEAYIDRVHDLLDAVEGAFDPVDLIQHSERMIERLGQHIEGLESGDIKPRYGMSVERAVRVATDQLEGFIYCRLRAFERTEYLPEWVFTELPEKEEV